MDARLHLHGPPALPACVPACAAGVSRSLLLRTCAAALAVRAQAVGLGEEDVGLIGVTYGDQWIELVPWNAEVEWDVDPWGRWWVCVRAGRACVARLWACAWRGWAGCCPAGWPAGGEEEQQPARQTAGRGRGAAAGRGAAGAAVSRGPCLARRWLRAGNDQYEAVLEARCAPGAGAVLRWAHATRIPPPLPRPACRRVLHACPRCAARQPLRLQAATPPLSPCALAPRRAPTATQGLAPACKDTFAGTARLRVWRRGPTRGLEAMPFIDATSDSAALEVGGRGGAGLWPAAGERARARQWQRCASPPHTQTRTRHNTHVHAHTRRSAAGPGGPRGAPRPPCASPSGPSSPCR